MFRHFMDVIIIYRHYYMQNMVKIKGIFLLTKPSSHNSNYVFSYFCHVIEHNATHSSAILKFIYICKHPYLAESFFGQFFKRCWLLLRMLQLAFLVAYSSFEWLPSINKLFGLYRKFTFHSFPQRSYFIRRNLCWADMYCGLFLIYSL